MPFVIVIFHRLCDPLSGLAILNESYQQTITQDTTPLTRPSHFAPNDGDKEKHSKTKKTRIPAVVALCQQRNNRGTFRFLLVT